MRQGVKGCGEGEHLRREHSRLQQRGAVVRSSGGGDAQRRPASLHTCCRLPWVKREDGRGERRQLQPCRLHRRAQPCAPLGRAQRRGMPAADSGKDRAIVTEHAERGGVALGQGRRGAGGEEAVRE